MRVKRICLLVGVWMIVGCSMACRNDQSAPVNAAGVTSSATNQAERTDAMKSSGVKTQTYDGTGVVKAVNAERRKITLAHEAIKDYMDAMTMDYRVKDKLLLDGIRIGDRVDFTLEDTNGIILITAIKKH